MALAVGLMLMVLQEGACGNLRRPQKSIKVQKIMRVVKFCTNDRENIS